MRTCKADDAVSLIPSLSSGSQPNVAYSGRSLCRRIACIERIRASPADRLDRVEGDRLPAIDAAAQSGCGSPRSQPDSRRQGF